MCAHACARETLRSTHTWGAHTCVSDTPVIHEEYRDTSRTPGPRSTPRTRDAATAETHTLGGRSLSPSQPTAYNLELSSARKRGGRFSRKARLPSAASSLR